MSQSSSGLTEYFGQEDATFASQDFVGSGQPVASFGLPGLSFGADSQNDGPFSRYQVGSTLSALDGILDPLSQKSELEAALHREFAGGIGDANANVPRSGKQQQTFVRPSGGINQMPTDALHHLTARDCRDGIGQNGLTSAQQRVRGGTLPADTDYAGQFGFEAYVLSELGGAASRTNQSKWIYSTSLRKLFVKKGEPFRVNFRWLSSMPVARYAVRLTMQFAKDCFAAQPVTRCPNDLEREKTDAFRDHFARCESREARYMQDEASGRFSVCVPCVQPEVGSDSMSVLYRLTCNSSCFKENTDMRHLKLVFTLESLDSAANWNETPLALCKTQVVGRRAIDVRSCACPLRDCENEENGWSKKRGNKQTDSDSSARPNASAKKRGKNKRVSAVSAADQSMPAAAQTPTPSTDAAFERTLVVANWHGSETAAKRARFDEPFASTATNSSALFSNTSSNSQISMVNDDPNECHSLSIEVLGRWNYMHLAHYLALFGNRIAVHQHQVRPNPSRYFAAQTQQTAASGSSNANSTGGFGASSWQDTAGLSASGSATGTTSTGINEATAGNIVSASSPDSTGLFVSSSNPNLGPSLTPLPLCPQTSHDLPIHSTQQAELTHGSLITSSAQQSQQQPQQQQQQQHSAASVLSSTHSGRSQVVNQHNSQNYGTSVHDQALFGVGYDSSYYVPAQAQANAETGSNASHYFGHQVSVAPTAATPVGSSSSPYNTYVGSPATGRLPTVAGNVAHPLSTNLQYATSTTGGNHVYILNNGPFSNAPESSTSLRRIDNRWYVTPGSDMKPFAVAYAHDLVDGSQLSVGDEVTLGAVNSQSQSQSQQPAADQSRTIPTVAEHSHSPTQADTVTISSSQTMTQTRQGSDESNASHNAGTTTCSAPGSASKQPPSNDTVDALVKRALEFASVKTPDLDSLDMTVYRMQFRRSCSMPSTIMMNASLQSLDARAKGSEVCDQSADNKHGSSSEEEQDGDDDEEDGEDEEDEDDDDDRTIELEQATERALQKAKADLVEHDTAAPEVVNSQPADKPMDVDAASDKAPETEAAANLTQTPQVDGVGSGRGVQTRSARKRGAGNRDLDAEESNATHSPGDIELRYNDGRRRTGRRHQTQPDSK